MTYEYYSVLSKIVAIDAEQLADIMFPRVCSLCGAQSLLVYRMEPGQTIAKLYLSYSPKLIHPLLQMMFTQNISHLFNRPFLVKDTIPSSELRRKILDSGDASYMIYPVFRAAAPSYFFYFTSEKEDNPWREDLVAAFSNMLALRLAEEEARKNLKNESFLLTTASHEIRTQISAFIGLSENLAATELSHEQEKTVTVLRQAAENMLQTLNGILDYSRLKAGKLHVEYAPFDVREMVSGIADLFTPLAEKSNTVLSCDFSKLTESNVTSDSTQLRRAVFNLVNNAVKFTQNGSILISAETDEKQKVLRITVKDTGIGIPASKRTTLFNEYEQVKASSALKIKGSGLGLNITYHIVKTLGGSIDWISEEGKGSRFWIQIPYSVPEQTETVCLPLRILIVDDEPISTQVVSTFLVNQGHPVTSARTKEEALNFLHRRSYDLILLDLHLPDGSGFDLFSEIRALPPLQETAVYALSASTDFYEESLCMNKGFNGFLQKPVAKNVLNTLLNKICAEKRRRFSDTSDEDTLFDLNTLVSFKNSMSPENFSKLVSEFLLHSYSLVTELNSAVKLKDYKETYRFAHNLKSAARVFGLTRLASHAETIENLSKPDNPDKEAILPLLKELETEYNKSTMVLQQYLQENK